MVGAQVGYLIGARAGPALLGRPDRPRLQAGVNRARASLERYGTGKAIVLARFIPVVRRAQPAGRDGGGAGAGVHAVAGGRWQVAGGVVWSLGVTIAGYVLGSRIPGIDTYLLPVIAVVTVVSLIPLALEVLRSRRRPAVHPGGRD